MSLCLEVSHHIEKVVGMLGLCVVSLLDVPSLVANTSMGGTIAALGPKGATGHGLPFVVRVALQGDVWVFCWGFKNRKESPNICKKKFKNICKKESERGDKKSPKI
jgi:hypothetical protein